jgi:hypothetical protein
MADKIAAKQIKRPPYICDPVGGGDHLGQMVSRQDWPKWICRNS